MRPVSHCDPSTTILGFKSSIPVFVSGAALAKLGHPLGRPTLLTLRPNHHTDDVQANPTSPSVVLAHP